MPQKRIYQYTVKFEPNGEGGYLAIVPALPEVQTEGWTMAEAEAMAKDAIKLCLKARVREGEPLPRDVDYKSVEAPKFFKLSVAL